MFLHVFNGHVKDGTSVLMWSIMFSWGQHWVCITLCHCRSVPLESGVNWEGKMEELSEIITGFSGREISKLAISWQVQTIMCLLTAELTKRGMRGKRDIINNVNIIIIHCPCSVVWNIAVVMTQQIMKCLLLHVIHCDSHIIHSVVNSWLSFI